jgi:hypothetical protein
MLPIPKGKMVIKLLIIDMLITLFVVKINNYHFYL